MGKNELKALDVNVINFILQNNKATIENLSNCFNVSQVNIRNVLAKIEVFIKNNGIGTLLKKNNEYYFENNTLNLNFDYTKFQSKNIEKSERLVYILLKLLFQRSITLSKISQELEISRITLNSDLEYIKNFLKEFNLDLLSIQWRGIFLEGNPVVIEKVSVLFFAKLYLEEYFTSKLKKIVNPLVINFFREYVSKEEEEKLVALTNKFYSHFDIQLGSTYYNILKGIVIFNYCNNKNNVVPLSLNIKTKDNLSKEIYSILSEEERKLIGNDITLLTVFLSNCIYKKYIPIFSFDMKKILKEIFLVFKLKYNEEINNELSLFINYIYFNAKFALPSYYALSEEDNKYLEEEISKSFIKIFNKYDIPFRNENIIFLYFYLKDLISEAKKQNILIIDNGSFNYQGKKLKEKLRHLESINKIDVISYFNFKFYSEKFNCENKYKTYIFIDLPFEKTNNYPEKKCIFVNSYDLISNSLDFIKFL